MQLIVGSLGTLALGLVLTPLVRAAAHRLGIVATPREDRWHRKPTALLGGIAIYVTFMVAYLTLAPKSPQVFSILAAGSLLFVIGLLDDLIQIKPYTKLVVQLIAAAGVVYSGLHLRWTDNEAINSVITILWLVGITNAVNLLDNMDGLAAGISLIACVFLTVTFLLNGQLSAAFLPALLGGVLLSFLVFNFNPASIFMGDSGSMFIGFVLSASALMSDYGRMRNLTSVLLTPVLIMMIPIFDTCMVIVSRKLSGRAVSTGGCDHTSHRLVALGMSEKRAVMLLYLFAAVTGLLALLVRLLKADTVWVLIPTFALTVLALGFLLSKVRVYEEWRPAGAFSVLNSLADFSYKRRILEVLLDIVFVVLAYYSAYLLSFGGDPPEDQFGVFVKSLPLVIAIQMSALWLGGVYRGLWRYVEVRDLRVIAKSVMVGAALSCVVVIAMHGFTPRWPEVVLYDLIVLLVFAIASRLSFRVARNLILGSRRTQSAAVFGITSGSFDGGELMFQDMTLRAAVGLAFVLALAMMFSLSSFAAPQVNERLGKLAGIQAATPAEFAGTLTGTGQVAINGNPAPPGSTVLSGSTVTTGPNGFASIDFIHLGRVDVLPNTSVSLNLSAGQVSVKMERQGSIIQSVPEGVRGELALATGGAGFAVTRGRVEVAGPDGTRALTGGERVTLPSSGTATILGNTLVTVFAAGDSRLPLALASGLDDRAAQATATTSPSLVQLTLLSAQSVVTNFTRERSDLLPADNGSILSMDALQPGPRRRPPASPLRP